MKNIFSKDCLIRVFYNVLKIIELIHKLGYVHRDIKPANFMLKLNPLYI
jgi:serine/threonine protein kinase